MAGLQSLLSSNLLPGSKSAAFWLVCLVWVLR